MPLTPRQTYQSPDFWTVYGHSFMQYAFGTYYQTGRADSLLRGSLDIEHANWQNYAVNGARALTEGNSTGGFGRFLQRVNRPTRGGPYVSDGGTLLMCYGINDMGVLGVTTQLRTAFIHSMRTMISRWRASVIYENDYQVGTRTSYGAGFSSVAVTGYNSGTTVHWCTDTTPDADDTFTLTLPSDYNGETVGIELVGASGVSGGIITWSGTAGITGTTNVSDITPVAAATHSPVLKRITTLTSANAGQTIIGTVTTMDSGGAVMLDCWWLESKEPPPVIVCNISRLTAAGYTSNYAGWTGTEASRDADVVAWNDDLRAMVAEFDSMTQIADIDSAINKAAAYYFTDGLHPNERGAARIVDSILDARRRLTPTSDSPTVNLNPSAPRTGPSLRPRISGQYYSADYANTIATITPAAGDLWAIPIWVTQGREFWTRLACMTGTTTGATAATQIRWGLYDDVAWTGYPRELVNEATAAGALTISTSASTVVLSPASGTGSITWVLDPGLYWLAIKYTVIRTTPQSITSIQGPNMVMPNATSAGAPYAAAANFPNGYKLTSQGTTALSGTFPTGGVATVSAPYIGVLSFTQPQNS